MTKFFYPSSRAHHAYSMAIDFGMKLKKRNGLWETESLPHLAGLNCQIEVAEESLHLLEPIDGDILFSPCGGGYFKVAYTHPMSLDHIDLDHAKEFIRDPGYETRIIQRNGLAFHFPESEAA